MPQTLAKRKTKLKLNARLNMSSMAERHVFLFLCKNEGSSDYAAVERSLRRSLSVSDQVLSLVLNNREKFVMKETEDLYTNSSAIGDDSLIVARTSLRVCRSDQCSGCEDLHLCKYLVCGNCRFGMKCKKSHDLTSAHNSALLKTQGLQEVASHELFQLLLQNDPSLLPEICSHYNKGNGEHGSCKYKTSCTNLHLCQHFLQDDCKFGASCKRAHAFDTNAVKILNSRGVSQENRRNLHKIYRNRLLIAACQDKPVRMKEPTGMRTTNAVPVKPRHKSSSSGADADLNEICLYFLRSGCSFKDKCVRVHHHLPYKWQILQKDGVTWCDLPNEEEVEKAFCNPANEMSITQTSTGHQLVNFMSMTCEGSPVRRLSTASSATKPPHYILTTQWIWYWNNEEGGWTEYSKGGNAKLEASVSSEDLENSYLCDSDQDVSFTSQRHQYILTFKGMYQKNLKYGTIREIRRRPCHLSTQEVKSKIKGGETPESSGSSVDVPAYWDKESLPSFTYMCVPLQSSSKEYQRVSTLFSRTMPTSLIRSIERVQNLPLWKVFQWQKEQMTTRNGGKEVNQQYLFHGTDESLIEAICEQNFDWRVCGSHGTLYGKGSYFARDASYSDKYAKSKTSRTKKMFVAQVLVGEFTRGHSNFVRPPPKNGQRFYDSCVDSETNPAIFVVFEKFQVYPEYIVEYS